MTASDDDIMNTSATNLSFCDAWAHCLVGRRIAREGWNGKGMYLMVRTPSGTSDMTRPYVYIFDAQQHVVPWNPSQTDLFAADWCIIAG